jgi:hypothetical protein
MIWQERDGSSLGGRLACLSSQPGWNQSQKVGYMVCHNLLSEHCTLFYSHKLDDGPSIEAAMTRFVLRPSPPLPAGIQRVTLAVIRSGVIDFHRRRAILMHGPLSLHDQTSYITRSTFG